MSVVKMEAVTIAGKCEDFERVVSEHILDKEIHLEEVTAVLRGDEKLVPYMEDNLYETITKDALFLLEQSDLSPNDALINPVTLSKDEMKAYVDNVNVQLDELKNQERVLAADIDENERIIHQFDAMIGLDIDLTKLLAFKFIKFRFGRLPQSSWRTLETFLGDLNAIFLTVSQDKDDVWGFYFVPRQFAQRVDAVFDSLYFQRLRISEKAVGTPKETQISLKKENEEKQVEIQNIRQRIQDTVCAEKDKISDIYITARHESRIAAVRKKAAHSKEFFYIVGWMPKRKAKSLEAELKTEPGIIVFREAPQNFDVSKPPTKLKNPGVFKPFEMFVTMYGLPAYGEIDPTPILAITYIFLFGIMFGDVGQSALFAIFGYLIYRKKKSSLAAIVSTVGISGILFGFIYGSIFGNETLLTPFRVIEPMEKIMFMLISTVSMGVLIILFCMVVSMINAVKNKNTGQLLFSPNGISGMLFYISLILLILNMVLKWGLPSPIFGVVMFVTFLGMYLQEPLSALVAGKKNWLPKTGMFYVESFFEMFDVFLSFITNTISFLRVGAFAIIHVGMMMVVDVLAAKNGMAAGLIIRIFGNILVMGLEGLIVGIQVLRLEYYEMFSRYFKGDGKEFKSI